MYTRHSYDAIYYFRGYSAAQGSLASRLLSWIWDSALAFNLQWAIGLIDRNDISRCASTSQYLHYLREKLLDQISPLCPNLTLERKLRMTYFWWSNLIMFSCCSFQSPIDWNQRQLALFFIQNTWRSGDSLNMPLLEATNVRC